MEHLASKKKDDFQARRLSIIDVTSEDDSLLGLAPRFVQDDASSEIQEQRSTEIFEPVDESKLEELFEPLDSNKLQEIPETDELVPQPSVCLEPERFRKNEKYNLRKSLAWDSAFFTCEGVLDAEELSSMISVDKSQKRRLPGIQEEVQRSTDSISTLGSDTLTLESVETSLFDDVRASIQRSRKPVKLAVESSKVGSGLTDTKAGSGLKKVNLASQPKIKPKIAAKKPSIITQNPGKLARPVSACPQFSQSVAASGVSTSSVLKLSKVLDKPIPSSTRMAKRSSLGGDLLKVEKDNVKISVGRGPTGSKLPGGLRNVPRPSKSSSLASSTATSTGPTSSFDSSGSTPSVKSGKSPSNSMKSSSGSTPSVKSGKSPSNSMKRKTDSNVGIPTNSSRSNPKTPSRITSGDKIESGKSCLSAKFVPSSKLSSSISPASSISDWSVESVSSTSSSQLISRSSRDSLSKSSIKRVSVEYDTTQSWDYDDQNSTGSATQTSSLPGQGALSASMGMVAFPPTSKPSGLRLPSPKIGFFDGVKSAVRTPKRNIPSNLPKSGSGSLSPQRSGIKSKLGKVNPGKAEALDTAKPDAQRASSKAATKEVNSDSRNAECCPVTCPTVKTNTLLKIDQEDQSKAEEVGNVGYDMGLRDKDASLSENKGAANVLMAEVSSEMKHSAREDAKITRVSEEQTVVSDLRSISNFENLTISEGVVKDAKHGEEEYKNDKLKSHSEDQIDCLFRQLGAKEIWGTEAMAFGSEDNGGVSELHSGRDILVCLDKEDSPNSLSKPVVSIPPTATENAYCKRIPFSAKDSLCNIGISTGNISTASEGRDEQPTSFL